MYSHRYSPYLLDLGIRLPSKHISLYSSGIASQTCKYNDKWIGLPVNYEFDAIYCNKKLLEKHKRNIPKTWDELLETGKYIRDNEEDTDGMFLYNGLFPVLYNNLYYYFIVLTLLLLIHKVLNQLGKKEGISGSTIGGTNIGINNSIPTNRKKLAVDALQYMTSLKVQKKLMLNGKLLSAINSLYDDPEVCQIIDCKLIKNIQPIARPSNITNNYDDYSMKFRKLMEEFLYENKSASETLMNIDNIVRIHHISIHSSTSHAGLHFQFLTIDFWIIILLGLILHLSIIFTHYGEVNKFKCKLRFIFISFGYSFILVPIFHKLISNFQKKGNLLNRIKDHKYMFLFAFLLYDILMTSLFIGVPYKVKINKINFGKNFLSCKNNNIFGKSIVSLVVLEKIIIMIFISFFIFAEWNVWVTAIEIRLITAAISVDIILYNLYIIANLININNLIANFLFPSIVLIYFTISNFIIIFGIKIIKFFRNNVSDIRFEEDEVENKTDVNSLTSRNEYSNMNHNSEISNNNTSKYYTNETFIKSNNDDIFDIKATSKIAE
ncbi:hypothetical protein H8356DRAFT_1313100 [Neocallimastix lanati (nom. inval.)]|uniref:G-protein coupled receptors family 3 profile domain-containing protein n=1 Tax=Neocallimastix californiae TaxID=1754190 RepID=A0A1Y2DM67_9FUNG|nr:hypothetical protein H8356DRAFT_1313100 [Neocallimastix sp. JGI-2020a]ORY60350.1 hypothetical protein LY90DRAFT_668742 [Neocallimastix californiae]|eukprot:ORY60350.1 hypothetical protein LY90DRAFT_668742 [Neocallimastix californiae]